MFDPDTDTYAYWFGYTFATVKQKAGEGDALCIVTLRQFCDHSRMAIDADREVLEQASSDDAKRSAGLAAQDALHAAARAAGYTDTAARNIASFSRRVPDTPGLRLAGVFECEPDPSCGQDGAA